MDDQVGRLFDEKSRPWTRHYHAGGKLEDRLRLFPETLAELLPAPARVLDFGCGTGNVARELARRGYDVRGCDVSAGMIDEARRAFPDMEWVRVTPGFDLPFDDATFDAVVASSVLEYVADPAETIRQVARVLRPRGIAVVTVPDTRRMIRRVERIARVVLHGPIVRRIAGRVARVRRYSEYLALSRNRFTVPRWRACFDDAGMRADGPARKGPNDGALVLLVFRKR